MTAHPRFSEGVIYPIVLIEIDGIKTRVTRYRRWKFLRVGKIDQRPKQKAQGYED